jgi:Mn2+/Fe2+ NRAMP family transporter
VFDDPWQDKVLYGLLHSAVAVILVQLGGYRLFEKVMSACIAVMVIVVVVTAAALTPSWSQVGVGLVLPKIPETGSAGDGLVWTVALMGGVGGTLTVLCYGYWIREEGRQGTGALSICRIDLAAGYAMTALFGISMVVIGDQIREVEGRPAALIVHLAERLQTSPELGSMGALAKWAFLVGAWGAVFSSLLGVWQSVPYLFADFWRLMWNQEGVVVERTVDTRSRPYRVYLFALAVVPIAGLVWMDFERAQLWYAVVGAMFIPMLALALLVLNSQSRLVGRRFRNSRLTVVVLIAALAFFVLAGWLEIQSKYHTFFG